MNKRVDKINRFYKPTTIHDNFILLFTWDEPVHGD